MIKQADKVRLASFVITVGLVNVGAAVRTRSREVSVDVSSRKCQWHRNTRSVPSKIFMHKNETNEFSMGQSTEGQL